VDIDLVYTWVNGNDPAWRQKFTHHKKSDTHQDATAKGRFFDNDELRFSLRSVEAFAGWVRKIFIVTDHQVPEWLNPNHPKITVVDHSAIIPKRYLPTFNANVIEWHLHNIPDLSEYFLLANDDFFFGRSVAPDFFFNEQGTPIAFAKHWRPQSQDLYGRFIQNTADYAVQRLDHPLLFLFAHITTPYRKSFIQEVFALFQDVLETTLYNRFRSENDLNRLLIEIYDHAKGRRILRFGDRNLLEKITRKYRAVNLSDNFRFKLQLLKWLRYPLFCVNDTEDTTDEARQIARRFLESYFPDKSAFEK
jgi:hypothetical protein